MPLPPRRVEFDPGIAMFGRPQLPASRTEAMGAAWRDPINAPSVEFGMVSERSALERRAAGRPAMSAQALRMARAKGEAPEPELTPEQKELLSPEEIQRDYGHLGIKYDQPTPRAVVDFDARVNREERRRQEIGAAAPPGIITGTAVLGTAFARNAVDPLNIASAVIPVLGPASRARLVAKVGGVGRAALVEGAAAGAIGSVPVVGATYAMSRQLQLDYDMSDALIDVAFGGVLGGGLHVAGAKGAQFLIKRGAKQRLKAMDEGFPDVLRKAYGDDLSKLPDAVTELRQGIGNRAMRRAMLGPDAGDTRRFIQPVQTIGANREALQSAHGAAVAQTLQGKEVKVDTVFEVDRSLQEAEARQAVVARESQPIERATSGADRQVKENRAAIEAWVGKWQRVKDERGRGRPPKDDPLAADLQELGNAGITPDMTEAQVREQAKRVVLSERRRTVLSRAQKAEAVAPHAEAIKTMGAGRSDWADYGDLATRTFEDEQTKPFEQYTEVEAEHLDHEAMDLLEREMLAARDEGEALEAEPELEAVMQPPKPAAPPKPGTPAKPPGPAQPEGPGKPEAEPIKPYSPKASNAIPAGQVGPDRAAGEFIFDAAELEVDAKTFQFKAGGDKFGITDKLQKVNRWDRTKAGKIVAYERLDGKVYVANGHQRVGLAKRIKSDDPAADTSIVGTLYREKDGVSPDEVTAIAAAVNIAEGQGSVIDMAKIARLHPELMGEAMRVSDEKQRMAFDLTHLGDSSFGMVVNEVVPYQYAATVGRLLPEDEVRQSAAMNLLAKAEPASQAEAESLVRQVASEDVQTERVEDLFGGQDIATSLVLEKAQVAAELGKLLRTDKRTFNMLTERKGRIEAAGNKLDAAQNEAIAARAGEMLQTFNTLAYRKGPISDALTKAAQEVKAGASKKTAARGLAEALARTDEIRGQDRGGARPQERPGTDQPEGDKGVRKGGLKASFADDGDLPARLPNLPEPLELKIPAGRDGTAIAHGVDTKGNKVALAKVRKHKLESRGELGGYRSVEVDEPSYRVMVQTTNYSQGRDVTSWKVAADKLEWPDAIAAFNKRLGTKGRLTDLGPTLRKGLDDAAGLPKGVEPPPTLKPSFVAYHGTPHDFDRFDIERIGTGEGAQVYGHGLYFAENKATAAFYREKLAGMDYIVEGRGLFGKDTRLPDWMGGAIASAQGKPHFKALINQYRDEFEARLKDEQAELKTSSQPWMVKDRIANVKGILKALDDIEAGAPIKKQGALYEVELKGEAEDYLDWDAPLSEQSPKVKALARAFYEGKVTRAPSSLEFDDIRFNEGGSFGAVPKDQKIDDLVGWAIDHSPLDGKFFYYWLQDKSATRTRAELWEGVKPNTNRAAAVSELLKKAGLKGIRYFDQGSRGAKEGTRNFVMFDDADIEIKMKAALQDRIDRAGTEAPQNPVAGLHAGFSPTVTARLIEGSPDLRAFVSRLPEGVTFKFTTGQPLNAPPGATLQGGFVAENRTLWLTSKALRPLRTLRHEEIHALRATKGLDPSDAGLFLENEWQLLVERAGKLGNWVDAKTEAHYEAWVRKYDPDNFDEAMQEEAVAHMVAAYEHGARFGSKIDAILERIVQFFEALKNAARGLGFQTADDVIRAIEAGEIGSRAQAPLEQPRSMAASLIDDGVAFKAKQPARSFDEIYKIAPAHQAELINVGNEISAMFPDTHFEFPDAAGSEPGTPGLKKRKTAEAKIGRKGYKSTSQLTDVVRGMFVAGKPEFGDSVVAELAKRYEILDEGWVQHPTGYFDRKVLVRFDSGLIGEVQIQEPKLTEAKMKKGGHDFYEKERALPMGDLERAIWVKKQQDLYAEAIAAADPDWVPVIEGIGGKPGKVASKSSGDMTAPESPTSAESTSVQSPPGSSTAKAREGDQTAGRPSQLTNVGEEVISQEIGFGPMFGNTEMTPAGEQAVIPGAEKEPVKQTLERKTEGAKKAKAPQKESAGPLFDDYQADLLEFARSKRADEIVQKAQDLEPGLLGMANCMARRS